MSTASPLPRSTAVLALLLLAAGSTAAQFKVVEADGSITYTDRPPAASSARVTALGRSGAAALPAGPAAQAAPATPADAALPLPLRQAAQRYPVTLYTSADCNVCDTGRQWLAQRGVPYRERRVATEEDAQALERLVGGRSVPSLTIGAQPLRGFSETDWLAYLDAAGYPRDARVPRGWQPPAVTPLVAARPVAVAAPPAAPPPFVPAPPAPPASGSIRF